MVTHPLGIAGFALALVFSVVGIVVKRKRRSRQHRWVTPVAFAFAGISIVMGFILAFLISGRGMPQPANAAERTSADQPVEMPRKSPQPSITTGDIEQKVRGGAAVGGVGGDVTINQGTTVPAAPKHRSQPKQR